MIRSKIKIRSRHVPSGLRVLYDDHDIIVIDKSAGLLSVKALYEQERTAHQLLTTYVRKGSLRARNQLFVVHRLDRETSGVMVFAKSMKIRELFSERWKEVAKTYLALVHGHLKEKEGRIESYLLDGPDYVVRSVDNPLQGKLSTTSYKVIHESRRVSLLQIDLVTGRKNQIRVHLADLGHPVVGDQKYGDARGGSLALHAWSLRFKHPASGEELEFKARVPERLASYLPAGVKGPMRPDAE